MPAAAHGQSDDALVDRVAFRTPNVVLGRFRLAVDHPSFHDIGPIRHHVVAFPSAAVWIEREERGRFVADSSLATVYNPWQPYLRHPISPRGDESDWIGVSEELAREIVSRHDTRDAMAAHPFRHATAPVSPALYLKQWQLFECVASDRASALEIEERALDIVVSTIAAAYGGARISCRAPKASSERDLVEDAKAAMLGSLFENENVTSLSRRVGVSPFHLCRRFRAQTGRTLHGYRREMRLRASLGLSDRYRGKLTSLALDLGFHSHSHFTTSFRRAFGVRPSALMRLQRQDAQG